jgi:uncharacterized secreted protein with C-terminal beta-propeller domain
MGDVKITFSCPPEVAERIDRLAKKADLTRSKLILNIVDEMSKTLEFTGKVGILQFALLLRNASDNLMQWAKNVKTKKVEPL